MKKLIILGASGHGAMCADAALLMNNWDEIVFADNAKNIQPPFSLRLIGSDEDALQLPLTEYDAFVAIGNAKIRMDKLRLFQSRGFSIATICHPSAVMGREAVIGAGTVLAARTVINPRATLGMGCIVNTGATIDHDCVLQEGVHVSVGAHLAGTVSVGARSWIGIGACISNNIAVCQDCMIGAGAAVIQNITQPGTYVGVPARRIK